MVQQLRSLAELHGRELAALAEELDAAGAKELAERLRVFRGLHADEVGVAIQELEDMSRGVEPLGEDDPAARSPRRARWLEDEARRATPRPLSRREVLTLGRESEPE